MLTQEPKTSSLPFSSITREENEVIERPLVIGFGEVLWDILPSGPTLGGAPANFAYACASLGAYSSLISRIGNDELGKKTRSQLSHFGIFLNGLTEDTAHPTGTVEVVLDTEGAATYSFPQNVAWDFLELSTNAERLITEAQIVCFGTLAQRTPHNQQILSKLLKKTTPETLIVFDVNIRNDFYTHTILRTSIGYADIIKMNAAELAAVCAATGIQEASETATLQQLVHNYSLQAAVLTKGITGSLVVTPDAVSNLTSFRVELEDTVGAGDAFTAAFALGFQQRWDLDSAHRKAAVVASFVCTQKGAMPQYPDGLRIIPAHL